MADPFLDALIDMAVRHRTDPSCGLPRAYVKIAEDADPAKLAELGMEPGRKYVNFAPMGDRLSTDATLDAMGITYSYERG